MREQHNTRRLHIAYVTTNNPLSNSARTGITPYIYQALQVHCGEVTIIGPISSLRKQIAGRLLNWLASIALRKQITYHHIPWIARKHARIIERKLAGRHFDLLIAAEATPEVAYVQTDIPLIVITDATFAQRLNYESPYMQLTEWSAQHADAIESRAYNNAYALLLNSQWAARSMVEDYFIDPLRVYSVPFGAPLLSLPPKEIALTKRRSYHCTLLFIGDNWQLKGGDIAFETLLALEASYNIQAELIICGTTPPPELTHPRIKIFPQLDRGHEMQRNELERLYLRSDFLLIPTSSETTGIHCCEAAAYGVPGLVADTGPLTEFITNGENGFVLPSGTQGHTYAKIIAEYYQDEQRYHTLVMQSRRHFEERLNWDAWGKAVQTIFQEIILQD